MYFTRKLLFLFFLIPISLFLFPKDIFASDKNIFGLHLTQPSDITTAAPIINSSGGNWGWVTIVIRTDQLDRPTWQDFFDNCRKYHLIPIVRLATRIESPNWKRPEYSDIDNFATFLNSLNWPTNTFHIQPFNEVNHGSEWGGATDPKYLADISIYAYQKFKSLNPSFYILSTPLDRAAPEKPPAYKSADQFWREIYLYKPEYFANFDAISSHCYPNGHLNGYLEEIKFLHSLGIAQTYPIFITETGWQHREGIIPNKNFYTTTTTANLYQSALQSWQSDPNITAITPFIYNYPNEPFDHFSWLSSDENLYPAYQALVNLPKNRNSPTQITKYDSAEINLPFLIFSDTEYNGSIVIRNTGQSIWGEGETTFCLTPQTTPNVTLDQICTPKTLVYPGQSYTFPFKFRINKNTEHIGKTFISWDGLSSFEINSFSGTDFIYRPSTSWWTDLFQPLRNFFRQTF